MNREKITDCKILAKNFYKHAIEYFAAFTCLVSIPSVIFDDKTISLFCAQSTNGAFACELFLKSLFYHYVGDFMKIIKSEERHNLFELFKPLPDSVKNSIADYVASKTDHWCNRSNVAEHLCSISNVFIDVRYIGQHAGEFGIFMSVIVWFCEALYQECKKVYE